MPQEAGRRQRREAPGRGRGVPPVLLEREATTDCGDESALAPLLEVVREEFPDLYLKSRPVSFGREVRLTVTASGVGWEAEAVAARLEAALARLRAPQKPQATPGSGDG